eukprot:3002270-Pleurochrysis_carterae.AAC.1
MEVAFGVGGRLLDVDGGGYCDDERDDTPLTVLSLHLNRRQPARVYARALTFIGLQSAVPRSSSNDAYAGASSASSGQSNDGRMGFEAGGAAGANGGGGAGTGA